MSEATDRDWGGTQSVQGPKKKRIEKEFMKRKMTFAGEHRKKGTQARKCEIEQIPQIESLFKTLSLSLLFNIIFIFNLSLLCFSNHIIKTNPK